MIVSKNSILQNFDSKHFDYSLKLFFSYFLGAQIGQEQPLKFQILSLA